MSLIQIAVVRASSSFHSSCFVDNVELNSEQMSTVPRRSRRDRLAVLHGVALNELGLLQWTFQHRMVTHFQIIYCRRGGAGDAVINNSWIDLIGLTLLGIPSNPCTMLVGI